MRPFIADKTFKNENFKINPLEKGDYENCVFESCQFQEAYLDNQNFTECHFLDCDLTNANITNTQFNEVIFEDSKLVGIRFETCNPILLQLGFKGCNLSLASFYEMNIQNTTFKGCQLHQVDYSFANLSKCDFGNANLKGAIFEQTSLEEANLASALNITIDPTQNTIKKARFSKEGLIGLLKKYDIVVE